MWNFLIEKIKEHPNSLFFDDKHQYTYSEFIKRSEEVGNKLLAKCTERSKCAILCDCGLNTALAILSCWYSNMIPIPMSLHYGHKHCESILSLTQPDILLTDIENIHLFPFQYNIKNGRFVGEESKNNENDKLNDIAVIMCTSGTTGIPKGALITNNGLQKNVQKIAEYFLVNSNDRIMIARPMYHCAVLTGEFLISIFKGLDIGFFDYKFHPQYMLQFVAKHKISVLCGTPTLFHHISFFLERSGSSHCIKKIALSGECLNKKTAMQIRKNFMDTDIYNVYGLTEASPRVSFLPPKEFDAHSTSVGFPLNGIEIKIVNKDGDILPKNVQGHIFIKTPCMMKSYYNNAEATQRAIINGWLNTGDIGYIDDNGFLYVLSRADDMIIKGGMNIYPSEIEARVSGIAPIQDCVAYRLHTNVGQEIAMDIVLAPEYSLTSKKELMVLLSTVLPAYQMPSELNIVDKLRRNASGKIIRNIHQ